MGFDCCSQVSSFDEYLSIRDTAMASLHPFYHEKWDSHQLTLPVVVDVAECILFVKDCIALHELITIDVLDAVQVFDAKCARACKRYFDGFRHSVFLRNLTITDIPKWHDQPQYWMQAHGRNAWQAWALCQSLCHRSHRT